MSPETQTLVRNFPEQFAAAANRHPDRLAVSVRGEGSVERFTYRELDGMARSAEAWLRAHAVQPGDRCALLAENSARWCAAYLGILKTGAIAVPFDTAYNVGQVTALLRDSGARVLLCSPRFEQVTRAAVDSTGCELALLAEITGLSASHPPADPTAHTTADAGPPCPAVPSDAAVILYTSGTTADPKGVVLTHANLLAEKDAAFQAVHVDERDAVFGVLPLFHSLAQMANLLLPFSVGAHVVFLDTLNTRELLRTLEEERISTFACVPQFFYLIHKRVLEETQRFGFLGRWVFRTLLRLNRTLRSVGINMGPLLFRRVHHALGPRMRLLITGGSKFDPAIGRDLHGLGFTILQAYGLTETSGAATLTRPDEPIETVGRPLPGVEIRIATADGTAEGMADGEVLIRGPVVMRGYWNRPDATAAVLRDGWLYTGDLGRMDAGGRLTITGRSKEMIVLSSGKNIYPEEIEAHYRQSAFVKELCVLGFTSPGAPASERLHAIVVPDLDILRARRVVNTGELIRFEMEGLSVSLPPHKRVLGFDISMEPLPRTTTGKLKRHEILRVREARAEVSPRANASVPVPGEGSSRPGEQIAEMEPHVSRVVAAVQEHTRPGVVVRPDSNFELDLGLDSMERVELLASLEQRFGVRISEAIAQSAFVVRDLADAFKETTSERAVDALPWDTMLAERPDAEASPQLQALLRPRHLVARVLWVAARAVVRALACPRVSGVEYLPPNGPYIVSPNHQSYLDPIVLAGVLPFHVYRQLFFVGAVEYFETPASRWLASQLNIVPVDPDANLLPAMQAAAFGLRHSRVLVLFPEGERSIDGGVKKFKKGAAILSRHLDVPIVPVAIDGLFDVWPRNRPLAWRRLLPWSGHRVTIRIGEPLRPAAGETYEQQTARLREAVERMWLGAHRP